MSRSDANQSKKTLVKYAKSLSGDFKHFLYLLLTYFTYVISAGSVRPSGIVC